MHSAYDSRCRKKQAMHRLKLAAITLTIVLMPIAAYSVMQQPLHIKDNFTPAPSVEVSHSSTLPPNEYTVEHVVVSIPASEAPAEAIWWSDEDVALLAAVISAESRGEPYEGQLAVGCVVLNRLDSGIWGDSLEDVLYAKNQFATPYWSYGESEEKAAIACLEGERILPAGVIFFQVKRMDVWFGASWYTSIGHHNFYEKEELS